MVGVSVIIVSNGHHRFITGIAAEEAYKQNLLAGFITAGYPTRKLRCLIKFAKLDRYAPINRFLKQQQDELPDNVIYTNWLSEVTYRFLAIIVMAFPRYEEILDYGLQLYAWQAKQKVSYLPAKIYHYRSGYGRDSVQIAKQKGMITLCDHSIAHPSLLSYLILNNGMFPSSGQEIPLNILWTNILKDIDQADFIIVNSLFVKETFLCYGYDPNRLFVLYTGIDDRFLSFIRQRTYTFAQQKPIKLLFAGNMGIRKGGKQIIQALSRIRDLPWQFEAIGSIEPSLFNSYREFFNDRRVTRTSHLAWNELAEHMSDADVFIFPSLAEGSARVVFMAMACGCYIITTPNSGSIVQDEIHGRVIPPGNVDRLEDAIRKCIHNSDMIPTIGARNANLIKSSYTQKKYGEGLIAIYQKLMTY